MAEEDVQGIETETEDEETQTEDTDTSTETKEETVSKADYDQLFKRMQAADRAKIDAVKKLDEIEKAKLGDLERTKADLEEAIKENATLKSDLEKTRIENAFHRENKYTWHDPADALAALDMSVVQIGEDGKVEGLKAAIDDVAKRKPHFVKKDTGPAPVATGDPANGKRKGEKVETTDRNALANRFPALRK